MRRAGPFVLGSQDKSFLLDGKHHPFPEVPSFVPYIVDWVLSYRHRGAWRFNCSDMYGNLKPFPAFESSMNGNAKTDTSHSAKSGTSLNSDVASSIRWRRFGLPSLLLYVLLVSATGSWMVFKSEKSVGSLVGPLAIGLLIFLLLATITHAITTRI